MSDEQPALHDGDLRLRWWTREDGTMELRDLAERPAGDD